MGVANVSLSIEEGELFVIMGLSGSGKSTLVRCLNRLIDRQGKFKGVVENSDILASIGRLSHDHTTPIPKPLPTAV